MNIHKNLFLILFVFFFSASKLISEEEKTSWFADKCQLVSDMTKNHPYVSGFIFMGTLLVINSFVHGQIDTLTSTKIASTLNGDSLQKAGTVIITGITIDVTRNGKKSILLSSVGDGPSIVRVYAETDNVEFFRRCITGELGRQD